MKRVAMCALVRAPGKDGPEMNYATVEVGYGPDDPWEALSEPFMVSWADTNHFAGSGTGPFNKDEVEFIGYVRVRVDDAIDEEARKMVAEDPGELEAHGDYLRELARRAAAEVAFDDVLFFNAGVMASEGWRIRRPA